MKTGISKSIKVFFGALSMFVLVASCNHLEEGIVIKKTYEPADKSLVMIPMKVGKTTIMQQYWLYDSEDWVLTIEGLKDGEMIHERVYVTQKCFESLSAGDTWIKTEDCSFRDNNNTKSKAD